MREIKFRFYDNVVKEMIVPTKNERKDIILEKWEFNPKATELMQYTGLKDKNGTEIYEGDIVENASKDLKFQVVYEAPSFNCKWIDDISKRYREHLTEPLAWNTYIICEVIGNIYENPELLGDSQWPH